MKMSGRPTKMSSHLQQKSSSNNFKKYLPTANVQKVVNRFRKPTGNVKKSMLNKPKAKHIRGKKRQKQSKQMKIVHNLDGKMGKLLKVLFLLLLLLLIIMMMIMMMVMIN